MMRAYRQMEFAQFAWFASLRAYFCISKILDIISKSTVVEYVKSDSHNFIFNVITAFLFKFHSLLISTCWGKMINQDWI